MFYVLVVIKQDMQMNQTKMEEFTRTTTIIGDETTIVIRKVGQTFEYPLMTDLPTWAKRLI